MDQPTAPATAPEPSTPRTPAGLLTVEEFLNSVDIEEGTDEVDTPERLQRWLAEHRLIGGSVTLDDADVERMRDFREALRSLALVNAGEERDVAAIAALDEEARRSPLRVRLQPDGSAVIGPSCDGVDGAVAGLLSIVARATADGTWGRLKACRKHSCRWAFYDHSRNSSRSWCTMSTCGNRTKAQRYRERRRPQPLGGGT
jgi:predicted RNA-binding Zn ribbon-like protein